MKLQALRREAEQHGLVLRGAFAPDAADAVPPLADGRPARALVLLGNAGSSLWPAFSRSAEYRDGRPHPLDRWSARVGETLAQSLGGLALYPFGGPPHHPFLHWARKAEAVSPSPVGMLIHADYGLWHAYRFALVLGETLEDLPAPDQRPSPCAGCSARPCLSACPVGAFTGREYHVERCIAYLRDNPAAACRTQGCAARHACPVGQAYRYVPAQAEFHMRAFIAARTAAEQS